MKISRHRCLSLLVCLAAMAMSASADAVRIDGLSAFEAISAAGVVPRVDEGIMHIGLPDARTLTVTPWPAFLPQRFGNQTVSGTRQMHPAGPVDRLSFSRASESSPWLAIGSGARRSTTIIENWQVQLSGRHWSITDGRTRKRFEGRDQKINPVMVDAGTDRWCIYLLESSIPAGQPHIAMEAEPQIGWAAIRLSPLKRRCSVQK